jgi:hypothetical protein
LKQEILKLLIEQSWHSLTVTHARPCESWQVKVRSIIHIASTVMFVIFYLRWVIGKPNHTQLAIRVLTSDELLRILLLVQHQDWHHLLILDESWFS